MNSDIKHLQPGTVLGYGKYRILRLIGAGEYGCTYEAEFLGMNTRVVIKEFFVPFYCRRDATGAVTASSESNAASIDKLRGKFVSEANYIGRMRHPNIVRVIDQFDENGTSYYVMDSIPGRTLQSIIDSEGPLPQARVLRYIRQVMDALEYVHSRGILHLDICPANIIINDRDQAILIDFGFYKQFDEIEGHNTSSFIGQTPGYAPLKQSGENINKLIPAVDIYALGATLYCALTGQRPPSSADIHSGVAHLSPLPYGTNPAIGRAIGLMMQPKAAHRPQSIAQVRDLLGETKNVTPTVPLSSEPVAPPPFAPTASDPDTVLANPKRPKRRIWLWAAIAVVVVAIGAAAYFLLANKDKDSSLAKTELAKPDYFDDVDDIDLQYDEPKKEPAPQPESRRPASAKPADTRTDAARTDAAKPATQANRPEQSQQAVQRPTQPKPISGSERGHNWVDMGTSVKWATTNVGASSPYAYGSYYAWGETDTKDEYIADNCTTLDISRNISGDYRYDAAKANWGGGWRMPTKNEWQELIDNCTWEWTGDGMTVTADNGNTLFIPAAGYIDGAKHVYAGQFCGCWSATPAGDMVWRLFFPDFDNDVSVSDELRYHGRSVRAVLD